MAIGNAHRRHYRQFDDDERPRFADRGGYSALRAASRKNPRNQPCPTCKEPNRLTAADVARSYQCNACADRDEGLSFGMDG